MKEKGIVSDDKKILDIACCALKGDFPKDGSFSNENELKKFSVFYNAVKIVCKIPPNKRKDEELREILQELKISNSVIIEILKFAICPQAIDIDSYLLQTKSRLPHISTVDWCVNVVISSSLVSRVMVPYVEVTLTLSDQRKIRFETNVQKFHSLRFAIAKLLKEMQHLELRPALQ